MTIGESCKAKGINPKLLINPEKYIFDLVKTINRKELQEILEYGVNVNIHDENGDSPLIIAIDHKEKNIVKLLLKFGADINFANFDGQTPLMIAYINNARDIANYLILRGADITAKDKWGQTAEDIKKSIDMSKDNYIKVISDSDKKKQEEQTLYNLYKEGEYYFDTGDYENAKSLFLLAKLNHNLNADLRKKINTYLHSKEILQLRNDDYTETRIPTYAEVKNRGGRLSTKRLQQGNSGYFMEAQYTK